MSSGTFAKTRQHNNWIADVKEKSCNEDLSIELESVIISTIVSSNLIP